MNTAALDGWTCTIQPVHLPADDESANLASTSFADRVLGQLMSDHLRPDIEAVNSEAEFCRWYWSVDLLKRFCQQLGLSASGSKAVLRERVAATLGRRTATIQDTSSAKSRFNWARESLSAATVITDSVSFGPNFRNFMKREVGPQFVCHADFMDWVRESIGLTLADAIAAWHALEARKQDPEFRREIAACNNYLQYLRDLRDAHPDLDLDTAKACWDYKKLRPANNGVVVFELSDIGAMRREQGH